MGGGKVYKFDTENFPDQRVLGRRGLVSTRTGANAKIITGGNSHTSVTARQPALFMNKPSMVMSDCTTEARKQSSPPRNIFKSMNLNSVRPKLQYRIFLFE